MGVRRGVAPPVSLAAVALAGSMLVCPAQAQQPATVAEGVALPAAGPDGAAATGPSRRLTTGLLLEQAFSNMQERPTLPNGVESITRLEPTVRLISLGGRVQGNLNYAGSYYYRTGREDSTGGEWQNFLDANFRAEAVERWAYVDASASIRPQAISAFGQPVYNARLANDNRTEVRTLSLSPYLTGVLGGLANYELRLTGTASNSSGEGTANSRSGAGLVSLASENRGPLGWRLLAKRERVDYGDSTTTSTTDRVLGVLVWRLNSDLRFQLNGGYENVDLGGPVGQKYENYGLGFEWTPSPRTRVAANVEERYFGRAHAVQVDYRMPSSVFSYTDTRNVNDGGIDPSNLGQPPTLYDLLYKLFTSIQPDSIQRDQLVLDYLAPLGRNPNEVINGGQLITGTTVQRRQFLGWAMGGRRTMLSLQAFRIESDPLDAATISVPGAGETVVESGYMAAISHRLTPDVALSLLGLRRRTDATSTFGGSDEKSAALALTARLGRRTTGSVALRYTAFNSPTDPFRDTELIGGVRLYF